MTLWRLYRRKYGPGLDGSGGRAFAGRWNEAGIPIVYFGASPAISVLEKLANVDVAALPADLVLARFEGELSVEPLQGLDDVRDIAKTRMRGVAFLRACTACVLKVPSVVLPEEANLVFNPRHPEATRIQLVCERPFSFDQRLVNSRRH